MFIYSFPVLIVKSQKQNWILHVETSPYMGCGDYSDDMVASN